MLPMTMYALALQEDRERDLASEHHWLLAEVRAARQAQPSRVRRAAALALAGLSRGSAAAVRRLDDCVADDLGRALAPTE